jgi:hypothetical protein
LSDQPLMSFKSHIAGKNADVNIYTDRVEWGQKSRMSRKSSSEVIPIKAESSVTVHRDGFRQAVKVICSGNTIDFRVGRGEAEAIKVFSSTSCSESIRRNRPRRAHPRRRLRHLHREPGRRVCARLGRRAQRAGASDGLRCVAGGASVAAWDGNCAELS